MTKGNKERVKAYVERLLNDIQPCICHPWFNVNDRTSTHINWQFFTETHRYNITASYDHDVIRENYLGGTVQTRKPRPGEDWNRGHDLPDGRLNQKTWSAIKHSIIRTEMIRIETPVERKVDEPEVGPSKEDS